MPSQPSAFDPQLIEAIPAYVRPSGFGPEVIPRPGLPA
jgi:hypothetical protein